jgi:hypothetical protein
VNNEEIVILSPENRVGRDGETSNNDADKTM